MIRYVLLSLLLACGSSDDGATRSGQSGADGSLTTGDYARAPADVASAPADATVTASGLAYKVIKAGTGTEYPGRASKVEVHYTGWTTDGKMFDSSHKRGKTISFGLNRVIAGWTEGLQLMVEGETARLWIPEELAYKGKPGKPAGMLVFDVELVGISKVLSREDAKKKALAALTERFPAPADVAAAPADAKRTASGLAIKTLTKSKSKRRPTPTDRVKVHYTGWQTDGTAFDSSYKRDKPATFPVGGVIAGWTEGLQLMREGEKARLWIPAKLAYEGKPGAPQGMLVFDVELLKIQ
jgi:FKBP-type peptidyl-prolyl cis-trans isomerase